ncbi:MAG: hypothetical protein H6R14_2328 [Proteobacteria bacterium]|nr:hypothetical protein [Pseudomonadota bacterium]
MHTLLFILAYIAFAFGARPEVTVAITVIFILVALVIQFFTKKLTDIQPPFIDALEAIGLSFFFLFLILLFFASAMHSTVALIILAINPFFIPIGLFGAFALGFSLSLQTTILPSLKIAASASLFAALLIVAARKLIFA